MALHLVPTSDHKKVHTLVIKKVHALVPRMVQTLVIKKAHTWAHMLGYRKVYLWVHWKVGMKELH